MNKTAIKNFAIWARNKLISDINYRAGLLGITADGIHSALPQSTGQTQFYDIGTAKPYAITGEQILQRQHLVDLLRQKEKESDYKTAYKYVLEEVAYTWFNRLIAVRFMEVNDYLPSHIRVLSSESGKMEPDLVTTPFDADLEFTRDEQQTILDLKNVNKLDEVFRLLFIKQCNALNEILPALFEKTSDYTELLLNLSVIDQDGVVWHLVHDIPESDFNVEEGGQVEIIGWLYQYYNTEPKNEAFAKKGKITKEEIPAVTQLFTPDWIVRYMVENSLGRIYIDKHKNEGVFADGRAIEEMTWHEIEAKRIANEEYIANEMGWEYYLPEAEQEQEVVAQLAKLHEEYEKINPEEIKVIDPCMGSGHILVYAFDVLMQIYESAGYGQRDAARYIIENNIYGIDIDKRAYQMAYFAVMMKARQYNRRVLNGEYTPNLFSIQESNEIDREQLKYFGAGMSEIEKYNAISQLNELLDVFKDAREYGSILIVKKYNWEYLHTFVSNLETIEQISFEASDLDWTQKSLFQLIRQGQLLEQQYHVAITNPPYMRNRGMNTKLTKYVKSNYEPYKFDMYAVFTAKMQKLIKKNGYMAMITQHSFMFLSRFEQIRKDFLNKRIINMVHLGTRAFEEIGGEVVQTTSFVINKSNVRNYLARYKRLVDFEDAELKRQKFFNNNNDYYTKQERFTSIPGCPIAYWVSDNVINAFDIGVILDKLAYPRKGNSTSNNDRFLRLWFEVDINKLNIGAKLINVEDTLKKRWYPYNKGGTFRKWYGNNDYVVDWYDDGAAMRIIPSAVIANYQFYMQPGITWSTISGGDIGVRRFENGYIFDNKGECLFCDKEDDLDYYAGFLNSKAAMKFLSFLTPTLDFNCGYIAKLPIVETTKNMRSVIQDLVRQNVEISKNDWDSYETSWGFKTHPFVNATGNSVMIKQLFVEWQEHCDEQLRKLRNNEIKLNAIFNEIYSLSDELADDVSESSITLRRANVSYDIKSLISFAVGCMFGRYSLDKPGICYAGGQWKAESYDRYLPDEDNVIPITDEEYLEDDIVSRLCAWLKVTYGEKALEDNLDFIAHALGNKGNSSRDIIRNYFLSDFFKEHCQTYSVAGSGKRPIYWLFDSGKQNGFKALIYLHRYNTDTIGNLRIDYLHRMQRIYESEINRMQDMVDHSTNVREVAQATKRREKLLKQLKECREFDEKMAHLALSRIDINMDDGVKVNYRKMQTANDGKFYEVLSDSKNIMANDKLWKQYVKDWKD